MANVDRHGRKPPGRMDRRTQVIIPQPEDALCSNESSFLSICGVTLSVCCSRVGMYGRQEIGRSISGILIRLDVVKVYQEMVRLIARQQGYNTISDGLPIVREPFPTSMWRN